MKHSVQFIGIDYSGAKRAQDPLPGLRVFVSSSQTNPQQILPEGSKARSWSRITLAHWLAQTLISAKTPCLVGIDHAFSFPEEYFARHGLTRDWRKCIDDFVEYWPSDNAELTVAKLLHMNRLHPTGRTGEARWRRLTERMSKGAKSIFHFGVPGAVASSTHAGIPWLRFLSTHPQLKEKIHFWPFDGWLPDPNRHVIAEVYPSLWNKNFPNQGHTQDEHDAWTICQMIKKNFEQTGCQNWFDPSQWKDIKLNEIQRQTALFEGWILGLH